MKKLVLFSAILLLITSFTIFAADKSEEKDPYVKSRGINDDFMINIGGFMPGMSTNIRIDDVDEHEIGTDISFEETLGMDSSLFLFRADGHLRFCRYFGLEFGYYNLSREASTVINEPIDFEDETFDVNAKVDSRFGTEVIKAAFKISVINDGRTELGFSIGANIIFLDVYLHAIPAGSGDPEEIEESVSEVAPLPLLGLHGTFTIIPGLLLKGHFQFFTLALDEFEGSSIDFRAALEYYPAKNIGVGVGLNHYSFNLEIDSDDMAGMFDYSYTGLVGYISFVL